MVKRAPASSDRVRLHFAMHRCSFIFALRSSIPNYDALQCTESGVIAVENVRMRGRIFSEIVLQRKKNEPLGLRIVGAAADAEDADRSKIFIESIVPKSLGVC